MGETLGVPVTSLREASVPDRYTFQSEDVSSMLFLPWFSFCSQRLQPEHIVDMVTAFLWLTFLLVTN